VIQPAFLRNFPGRYIRAIVENRRGNIWIATNGQGAYKFADGRWTVLDTRNGLSNVFVSCITEDSSGTIWIGTSGGGLNRLSHDSITTLRRGSGLTSDFVTALHLDADEALWIGTNGGGLCRMYRGQITSWTTAAGLVDEVIFAIVDDTEGNLWLSGPRGISRVSKQELNEHARSTLRQLHVVSFDETDGMRSSECSGGSQNAGCRTKDGRIWIPTVDGLVVIDPRSIRKDSLGFPVYIEQLAIDKVPMKIIPPITADFANGEIEVHYTALSFRNAKKLQFRYRLEGFEDEWQDAGRRRTAYYTNVPPGEYVFHVETDAGAGAVAPHHASIMFKILPPFWMTGWFRAVLGLGVVGVVVGSVRYFSTQKLKRKLEKVETQAALERERVRISKDMHDELGANLTKISLLSELARRSLGNPEEIEIQLDKVSNAARETADTMDEIVWAVNPRNDTLDSLAAYILQYVEEYLSVSDLQCKIEVSEDLPARHVSAEMRHNIFLVIKEGLNNIVKHSEATSVRAGVRYVNSLLEITLEDNGRGFSLETVGKFSDGLANMRRRMEEIGGTFDIEGKLHQGTNLKVSVPL
jgi:signal transduction histidine kinase